MALDEELLSRSGGRGAAGSEKEDAGDAASDRAGALRQARRQGEEPEEAGDQTANLRQALRLARAQRQGAAAGAGGAVASPLRQAASGFLKACWRNLIPSWGFSLLGIDAHVFLSYVIGRDVFCDLGEEWLPAKPGGSLPVPKK